MKKKLFSLCLVATMLVGLVACGEKKEEKKVSVDETAKTELQASVEGLKNLKEYVITTGIEMPSSLSSYIEVVRENFNYTEYPVDAEGNIVDAASDEAGNSYMLADWMSADNFYTYSTDSEGNVGFYILPKSYKEICQGRTTLYMDIILNGLTELKKTETKTSNLGDGDKEYQMYEGVITSDAVRKLVEPNSYSLYDCLEKDYKESNPNVSKYGKLVKEDLDFNLVYGDGRVTFAVSDGVIRSYTIEIGGLGTRMYYTKSVITNETECREEPDFSGAKDYTISIQSMADMVAKYDTYGDALKAMYSDTTVPVEGTTESTETEATPTESTTDAVDTTEESTTVDTNTEESTQVDTSTEAEN